ncbi:hypothetical protein [Paludisphaera rhizosphaerae]|uniref:hypothetical protein n=1 Tax=Paludisphaera rhizosphaerae TaxID=2711216 RepID=UPI0013EAD198|nr:hypothetical protein [Paludisphaera rhizosphaerae]
MKRLIEILLLLGLAAFVLLSTVHVVREDRLGPRGGRSVHVRFGRPGEPRQTRLQVSHRVEPVIRQVAGRVSATEERAKDDALRTLETEVADWLGPQVASSWHAPAPLLRDMVEETRVTPTEKDYGTVYTAVLDADFSDSRRNFLIDSYRREVGRDRTIKLGAGFGFLLACLAAVSGYIRADEATRGYYTNRLRLAAAAAVGASGVILYRYLV